MSYNDGVLPTIQFEQSGLRVGGGAANNAAAINAALAAAAAGGGICSVTKPGTYRVLSSALVIPAGVMLLRGPGVALIDSITLMSVQALEAINRLNDLGTVKLSRRIGNVGTKAFRGSLSNYNSGGNASTWQTVVALSQHFDAIRLVYVNNQTVNNVPILVGPVRAMTVTDAANLAIANNGQNGPFFFFNGATTGAFPQASTAQLPTYLFTDWLPYQSLARTDSGTLPLISIRTLMPPSTAGNITVNNYTAGPDDVTNWVTKADGRVYAHLFMTGDGMTVLSNFAPAASSSTPLYAVQYMARGKVFTVAGGGDSITEGRGTYIGEGFIHPAVYNNSDINGIACEYANFGFSGQTPDQYGPRILDLLAAFSDTPFDVLVYAGFSPNFNAPLTAANIATCQKRMTQIMAACSYYGTSTIFWTGPPIGTSVHAWAATDSLRVAFNATLTDGPMSNYPVIDFATPMSGVTTGGQVQPLTGVTSDDIHPNDTGNAIGSRLLTPVIAAMQMSS